jgi:hypothetical protein
MLGEATSRPPLLVTGAHEEPHEKTCDYGAPYQASNSNSSKVP